MEDRQRGARWNTLRCSRAVLFERGSQHPGLCDGRKADRQDSLSRDAREPVFWRGGSEDVVYHGAEEFILDQAERGRGAEAVRHEARGLRKDAKKGKKRKGF